MYLCEVRCFPHLLQSKATYQNKFNAESRYKNPSVLKQTLNQICKNIKQCHFHHYFFLKIQFHKTC